VDGYTFTKPVLSQGSGATVDATYVTDPLVYSYPDNTYVTIATTDASPGAFYVGTLTHTDGIPVEYGKPTRVRVRAYHFSEDDYAALSEWSDPITVSPPTLEWKNTGQIDLSPHEPKRYEGYGSPDESGVDFSAAMLGDTYVNLDDGMYYELGASDGTFGAPFDGPPDAPGGLTVSSAPEDTLAGDVRLEWPTAAHADWYNLAYRDYIDPVEDTRGPNDELNFIWQGITTSYTAHIYTPGTYEFAVNAGNNTLNGGNSLTDARVGPVVVETGSTTHGPEAIPGPAENLQITANEPASVTFTWEPPSDTRLGDAAWYLIEHSADGSAPWDMIEPAAAFPDLTTTITNLAAGEYWFRVLSINDYGSATSESIGPVEVT
jgi:Fibronectin type III domain